MVNSQYTVLRTENWRDRDGAMEQEGYFRAGELVIVVMAGLLILLIF